MGCFFADFVQKSTTVCQIRIKIVKVPSIGALLARSKVMFKPIFRFFVIDADFSQLLLDEIFLRVNDVFILKKFIDLLVSVSKVFSLE